MSQIKYWLWLAGRRGLVSRKKSALIEEFGGAQEIFFANSRELERAGATGEELRVLEDKNLDGALRLIENCRRSGVRILTMQDADYPARLRSIYDPPSVLYIIGSLPVMDEEAAVAVAGTRKATPYGIKMGRRMGFEITKCGGLVVSGLAEGVDAAGAEGALRAGGSVVGVLGTAIDLVYPKTNRKLFEDVASVGALVSEYPPGAPGSRSHFPARNRILSGLSVGVVIIEAPKHSGALITASHALEQGRDIFVVPGNADAENCVGSNELMKECAKPVTSGWEVVSEYTGIFGRKLRRPDEETGKIPQEEPITVLVTDYDLNKCEPETGGGFELLRRPSTKKVIDKKKDKAYIDLEKQLESLSERQLRIVSSIKKSSTHVDDIIDLSGLDASSVLAELTMLEINGIVRQEKGKRFSLNTVKS